MHGTHSEAACYMNRETGMSLIVTDNLRPGWGMVGRRQLLSGVGLA